MLVLVWKSRCPPSGCQKDHVGVSYPDDQNPPPAPPKPTFGLCGLYKIMTLGKQAKGRTGVLTSHKEKSVHGACVPAPAEY